MSLLSCFGAKQPPKQMVMLGLKGAGKTTLLYQLLMGGLVQGEYKNINKLVSDMKGDGESKDDDISYHYEELTSKVPGLRKYGLWDVPGSLSAVWPTFYRYIRITATIFVVNASKEATEKESELREAKRVLAFLLNEDELRQAAFIVIINEQIVKEVAKNKRGRTKRGKKANQQRALSQGSSVSADSVDGVGRPSITTTTTTKSDAPKKGASSHIGLPSSHDIETFQTPYGDTVYKKLGMASLMKDEWNQSRLRCFFVDVTNPHRWKHILETIHKINIIIGNDS